MTGIGGDAPVLLRGFARDCCTRGDTPLTLGSSHLHTLAQFEAHRQTVVDLACKEDGAGFYSGDHRARQNVEMKFGDFLDYFTAALRGDAHWLGTVDGLQFYLCQCPIAVIKPDATCTGAVLPSIMELFHVPPSLSHMQLSQVNLWMGIKASSTGIHYDAYRNVLVVLHGKKTVKLYPPSQSKYLYARPVFSSSANHSLVNFLDPDLSQHPDFVHATPMILSASAGDAIYIPEGWWHQVDSDPFTVAVNYWFDGQRDSLVQNPAMHVYYARVLMEEMVRNESTRLIADMRATHRQLHHSRVISSKDVACATLSQLDRESLLFAVTHAEMHSLQLGLATEYPSVWRDTLCNASDALAAVLADVWDRLVDPEQTLGEEDQEQEKNGDWIHTLFDPLGDLADAIKHQLLDKHERFKRDGYRRVVDSTFGSQ